MPVSASVIALLAVADKNGEILLIRRRNTAHFNGSWLLVAGHLENGETAAEACAREAREEAGLELSPSDLELAHVMHVAPGGGRGPYVNFYFTARDYSGPSKNAEPDKCSEVAWFSPDSLPDEIIPMARAALDLIRRGVRFSEYGFAAKAQTSLIQACPEICLAGEGEEG